MESTFSYHFVDNNVEKSYKGGLRRDDFKQIRTSSVNSWQHKDEGIVTDSKGNKSVRRNKLLQPGCDFGDGPGRMNRLWHL